MSSRFLPLGFVLRQDRVAALIFCAAFLCGVPGVLAAQTPAAIDSGSRVRLTLAPGRERVAGTVVRLGTDSVALRLPASRHFATRTVSTDRIIAIEVFSGRHRPVRRSALWGAAIGGATIGVVLGVVGAASCDSSDFLCDEGLMLLAGVLAGAVSVGAPIGLIVGLIGRDRWVPATMGDWQPVVTASRRSVHLGWRIRLPR